MQYALMIHVHPASVEGFSEEERVALTGEYMALRSDPRFLEGAELAPPETASTVRVQDGDTLITDGPFADTKEVLGGYYVIEAPDLDSAIEFAGRIPAARMGGAVEVWPHMVRDA